MSPLVKIICLSFLLGRLSTSNAHVGGSGRNETCVVPPYSLPLYEVNATDEVIQSLLVNGRCFLKCLYRYTDHVLTITQYPIWPYAIPNAGCAPSITEIHECTRGCEVILTNPTSTRGCAAFCEDQCIDECDHEESCQNPDSMDLWAAQSGCAINCTGGDGCSHGCDEGLKILRSSVRVFPLSPEAPPSLLVLNYSSAGRQKGLYWINLTDAVGARNRTPSRDWNGFIFKILDLNTSNITYIWQRDLREYLNLSSHMCRTVEVSFCVVNPFGASTFSEPATITVIGDDRQVPNAPYIRHTEDFLDERIGFFQNVLINVTWESPQDDTYLISYEVILQNELLTSPPEGCSSNDSSMILLNSTEHTSQRFYSIILETEVPRRIPVMGCPYNITVKSIGQDGNGSVSKLYTSKSLQGYKSDLLSFNCSKSLRENSHGFYYFQFHYKIAILTANLVENGYFSRIVITKQFSSDLDTRRQEETSPASDYIPGRRVYDITDNLYTRLHLPSRNPDTFFIFNLRLDWNANQIFVALNLDDYTCQTGAQPPPPSDIRNFTLHSAMVVGSNATIVSTSWLPPLYPNGKLTDYLVCVSPFALSGIEAPRYENLCVNVTSNLTSMEGRVDFISLSNFVHLQMRPSTKYRIGNWTVDYEITVSSTTSVSLASPVGLTAGEIAAIAVFMILVVITVTCACIICMACAVKALRRRKKLIKQTETMPNYMPMFSASYAAPSENPKLLEVNPAETIVADEWEISPTDITVGNKLGEGAFGEVYRGSLKGPLINNNVKPEFRNSLFLPVAMKLLKDSARGSERQDFFSEIDMMKKVSAGQNPHVVAMLGCVTTQEPLCLLTEFVQYGDLLSYLRSSRAIYLSGNLSEQEDPYLQLGQLTPADLPSFSYQIAAGMAYLSSIGIVHRDLACRNVLVSADKALKITDFGMSRETEDVYVQKSKGRVPYKWMAIESIIAREFTSASDVWSYGVTLWEIETIGGVPYPGVSNAELLPLIRRGHRMDKPERSSSEVYDIMLSCWQENPSQRPTFNTLKLKFNDILSSHGSDTYVDFCIDPNHLYYKNEEDTDIPPAYKNLLHPAVGNDRRSKTNFPAGFLEAASITSASPSPREVSPIHGFTKSPSMDKLLTGNLQPLKPGKDRRPKSMMLLKHNLEHEHCKRSGIDNRKDGSEDDRYVRDPSALLNVPQLQPHGGEAANGRSGAPEVGQAGGDGYFVSSNQEWD